MADLVCMLVDLDYDCGLDVIIFLHNTEKTVPFSSLEAL